MAVVFGILGLVLVVLEEVALTVLSDGDFSLLHIVIIIVPIGSMALGAFIGFMTAVGIRKGKTPFGKQHVILVVLIALLARPMLYFVQYNITYVKGVKGTINYKFDGDPMSDYMSFPEYMEFYMENAEYSISSNNGRNEISFGSHESLNVMIFVLEILCFAGAAYLVLKGQVKDMERWKCQNPDCGWYMKDKIVLNFNEEELTRVTAEAQAYVRAGGDLKQIKAPKAKGGSYFSLHQAKCPRCGSSLVTIRKMQMRGNNLHEVPGSCFAVKGDYTE